MIREIYDQDEQLTKDRNEMLKIIKSFYEIFYSTSIIMDDKDSLFLIDIPKLSEENRNLCEGKVTRN